MAGCMGLMQAPIFFMLCFNSFGNKFETKGFLWADDLSSFDSIYELPFHIPACGSHISLFPILASIFFYMKMTTGDQQMAAPPTQEGAMQQNDENHDLCFINDVVFL
jgi:YidC/Oxa1 family membrane protein insertase